jgi:hypothetical protein
MAVGLRTFSTNDRFAIPQLVERHFTAGTVGNVTSAPTSTNFTVMRAGKITAADLSMTMGADNTNPLSLSCQVTNTNTGNTLFSTVPSIAKAAGNVFASTLVGGTGVTPPTLNAANVAVKAGDNLKIVWTLTRTASPQTEIADAGFTIVVAENQDFDPAVS